MKNVENIILVDEQDNEVGLEEKIKCHLQQGILHRAFSVFIFNSKNELLLQKRSSKKMLWPLYWTNTCCSHQKHGEDFQTAGRRRLKEELGFDCLLKFLGKFQYQANYNNIGSENELCYVLSGKYNGQVKVDKNEIAEYKWIDFEELKKDVKKNPDKYTPWFKLELKKFFNLKKYENKK